MTELSSSVLNTVGLTKELATQHINGLVDLANQIPEVEYTAEMILSEQKGDRQMLGKWAHSLVVLDADTSVAFIMAYEREAENNEQYPENTLYISELAVSSAYQRRGIAHHLLKYFFDKSNKIGMLHYDNALNFSIQTNSAEWNEHVINLYKSFGFRQRAVKEYANRSDVVLGANANQIRLS